MKQKIPPQQQKTMDRADTILLKEDGKSCSINNRQNSSRAVFTCMSISYFSTIYTIGLKNFFPIFSMLYEFTLNFHWLNGFSVPFVINYSDDLIMLKLQHSLKIALITRLLLLRTREKEIKIQCKKLFKDWYIHPNYLK